MRRRSRQFSALFAGSKRKASRKAGARVTQITFNADELEFLAQNLAAGIALLPGTKSHPGLAKIKSAMTRLGVTRLHGL